ncbi:MAG: glycine--tRNA ligase subunit beta [Sterolibacterium sp.]|nr:glycine--tRNA ligase subunit beta [Sterolibacterium sp.]
MKDMLLVELLTEELPPKSLARLAQAFHEQLHAQLLAAGFIEAQEAGRWLATPRRLAVQFEQVQAAQPDRVIERKGPAVVSGLEDNGQPSKALQGFMRSAGVSFEQLERTHDGKAEYFVARQHKAGEALDLHLATMVEAALKKLPVAKLMRWGAGEAQFVRPVHRLLMLHGSRVVPGNVLGLTAGNVTRGHRFMSAGEIVIANAADYVDTLRDTGKVIADFAERREMIRTQLQQAAGGLQCLEDAALLDEVTALVEYPAVYAASFEAEYLAVPQECLILTMKANQKYFPLFEQGKLSNRFLVVSNMAVVDPTHIIEGNARVVRPRLADAKFFFETDRRLPLQQRAAELGRVIYHNKLGTQQQRVERLVAIARQVATLLRSDVAQAERAALLCKADLTSLMVGEFPELQGTMGRYYALHDGEAQAVADAIEAHYRPRYAGDALPQGNVACAVALADKLDALAGLFSIGQIPTGDKDPFGLRRAALGVLRILLETPLPLPLDELIGTAMQLNRGDAAAAGQLFEFMLERLRGLLRDAGHAVNAVDAVLALKPTRIDLVTAKLEAVRVFSALPEAEALAVANKRIVNILKKSALESLPDEADVALLQAPAEKALFEQVVAITPHIRSLVAAEDYTEALTQLAGLRAAVDRFFEDVMVMAEETLIRQNRLALLKQLAGLMNQVADISRL